MKCIPGNTSWSWLRECQVCAKLSSKAKDGISNIKYILICLTILWLLHDSMCYFIVMSSLLFYKCKKIVKIKKNPWMSRCVQTFDWYCIIVNATPTLLVLIFIYFLIPFFYFQMCMLLWIVRYYCTVGAKYVTNNIWFDLNGFCIVL